MGDKVLGFTQNGSEKTRGIYDVHQDRLVNLSKGQNVIYGNFKGIFKDELLGEFIASIHPSMIFNPDDTYSIDNGRPTYVPLPFDIIRPIKGTLNEWVKKFNKDLQDSKELYNETQKGDE